MVLMVAIIILVEEETIILIITLGEIKVVLVENGMIQ